MLADYAEDLRCDKNRARAYSVARILLVDDNDLLRRTLAANLAKSGYDVMTASCAEGALSLLAEHPFDCLLSNFMMPGAINGAALGRYVRDVWPHVRIVLMTGYSALQVANSEFPLLRKPFSNGELLGTLSQLTVAA